MWPRYISSISVSLRFLTSMVNRNNADPAYILDKRFGYVIAAKGNRVLVLASQSQVSTFFILPDCQVSFLIGGVGQLAVGEGECLPLKVHP